MATTYPLATLAASVTSAGITAPAYSDIYASLQASFKSIYATDAYIDPDSQDGQLLAVFAKAISDCNSATISAYNTFSPTTAQGVGLSSLVKLNGIARLVATNSQVNVLLVGQVGTVITNGVVSDLNKNKWNLPTPITIPLAGQILVTASAQNSGALVALAGTVNVIETPTLGWQTVNNSTDATPGATVELDATLRKRQTQSVALPSLSALGGIVGAVQAVTGVTSAKAYENDTGLVDSNGLPANTIALVVSGGSANSIASAILLKKTPGCGTYGTTVVSATDSVGVIRPVRFFVPTPVTILVSINLHPLNSSFTTAIGTQVGQAIIDYINGLTSGDLVDRARLYLPAQLFGSPLSLSYDVTSLLISRSPASPGSSNVTIAFNEEAVMTLANLTLTTT
jgi:uncharacterized phage protein gp47/JayE